MNDALINIVSRITSSDQCVAAFDDGALTEFVQVKLGNQSFEIRYITEARMLDLLKKITYTYINFISIRIVNSTIVLVSPNTINYKLGKSNTL